MSEINKPKPLKINWGSKVGWSKYEQVGYNQACMDWEAYHKHILDSIELCTNCEKGKVLSPDGDSAITDCEVCRGRGFRVK